MLQRPRSLVWLVGLICLVSPGCGPSDEDRAPVQGVVRYRGERLAGGAVVFTPDLDRGTPDEMATAKIEADGSYRLLTDDGKPINPGWYRVSIIGPRGSKIPTKYQDPIRSGLERQVRTGRENVFDFDLE